VIAPIFTNKENLFLQTTYFPLQEYGKQRSNQALDVLVQSPQYKPDGGGPVGYLDVSATYDPKTRRAFLNVLNRNEKQDIAARISNAAGPVAGSVDVWELNHPDLKATHTFGNDKLVRPATKTVQAGGGGAFSYTFPKHSLTILTVRMN
jgi:alpha-N-arabinofuranosidase